MSYAIAGDAAGIQVAPASSTCTHARETRDSFRNIRTALKLLRLHTDITLVISNPGSNQGPQLCRLLLVNNAYTV